MGVRLVGVEAGVVHAQRVEDRPSHVRAERFVGDHFDQPRADVGRPRVEPLRPRLETQRLGGEQSAQVGERRCSAAGPGGLAAEEALHVEAGALRPRPDPRHVHQRVLDTDRPVEFDEVEAAAAVAHAHLRVTPLGKEPVDRVAELHTGLLDERQESDGGDRFRHRVPAPDRLVVELLARLEVHRTDRGAMGQLAPAADQHLAAGDLAGVDVRGPEVIVDAGETGGVEARRRRICGDATINSRRSRARARGRAARPCCRRRSAASPPRTSSASPLRTWPAGPCLPRGAGSRWRT